MKNEKKGLILFHLTLFPSAIAFLISASHPSLSSIAVRTAIGCLLGIAACRLKPPVHFSHHRLLNPAAIVLSVIGAFSLCTNAANAFFYSRFPYSQLFELLRSLVSSPKFCVRLISYMLGIACVPFVVYTLYLLISCLFLLLRSIHIRKLWHEFTSGFSAVSCAKAGVFALFHLLAAVLLGTGLLYGVYSLPLDAIQANVDASADIIYEEGAYPKLYSWATSRLDNYTDSTMLLEASDDTDNSTISRAMNVYRGGIDELDPSETLIAHYIDDRPFNTTHEYTRYWHGYHVFLKPLLMIMDYGGIRILNATCQLLCILAICFLFSRNGLRAYILPFLVSYLMLMPAAIAKSLQFSTCFYIITLASMAILGCSDRRKNTSFVFLNAGLLTSFLDFLTYPIATFGVPAILCLTLQSEEKLEQKLLSLVKSGIFWCIGFGGMWMSKWIAASITVGYDFFGDAFQSIGFRLNGTVDFVSTSLSNAILSNYQSFFATPVTLLAAMLLTGNIVKATDRCTLQAEEIAHVLLPYALVALAPVVWFAFARNHSAVHFWFTNKACIVTAMAVLFASVTIRQLSEQKKAS